MHMFGRAAVALAAVSILISGAATTSLASSPAKKSHIGRLTVTVSPAGAGKVTAGSKHCTSVCTYSEKVGATVSLKEKATSKKKPFEHWIINGVMGKNAASTKVKMTKSTKVQAVYK